MPRPLSRKNPVKVLVEFCRRQIGQVLVEFGDDGLLHGRGNGLADVAQGARACGDHQAVEIALLLMAIEHAGQRFEEFGFAMLDRVGPGFDGAAAMADGGMATAGSVGHNILRGERADGPIEAPYLLEPLAWTGVPDMPTTAAPDSVPGAADQPSPSQPPEQDLPAGELPDPDPE